MEVCRTYRCGAMGHAYQNVVGVTVVLFRYSLFQQALCAYYFDPKLTSSKALRPLFRMTEILHLSATLISTIRGYIWGRGNDRITTHTTQSYLSISAIGYLRIIPRVFVLNLVGLL